MTERYRELFADLQSRGEGAFVPFVVLGDPDPNQCLQIISALVQSGADAIELGFAFSDPIADGPTIQKANQRALAGGVRSKHAWQIVSAVRQAHPKLPIGLLIYANLVGAEDPDPFYRRAAENGVDSVLVADVPTIEAGPYANCARRYGIAPVLMAYPNASDHHLREIAALCEGYTYVLTRSGVTGVDEHACTEHRQLIAKLARYGAPPCLLGFGISRPEHVRNSLKSGAAGAISGSAVVRLVERHINDIEALLRAVGSFVKSMKAATRIPTSLGKVE